MVTKMFEVFALIVVMLGIPMIIGLGIKYGSHFWLKWNYSFALKGKCIYCGTEKRLTEEGLDNLVYFNRSEGKVICRNCLNKIRLEREQEQERLRKEAFRNYIGLDKVVIEKETIIKTSLWKCEYCNTSNNGESLNCVHCGSPRKIGDE